MKIIFKQIILKVVKSIFGPLLKMLLRIRMGRELFFLSMPKNQLLIAHTNEGIDLLVNTSDLMIGLTTFIEQKSYDANHLITALALIGSSKSILIDVGANIGTIGIFGISKGYFKKCIAFEPEPKNFKLLRSNVFLNNLSEKFELRNEALSNQKDEKLNFELSENNHGDHRALPQQLSGQLNEVKGNVIKVDVNTLDSALEMYELDECLLFIDSQGFEGHILSGAKNLIQKSVPIVMEFWPCQLSSTEGLGLLYEALSESSYTSMWDLSNPAVKIKFSIENLKKIELKYELNGDYTDLVLVNEHIV
jgi:FkbM family methyltransferase